PTAAATKTTKATKITKKARLIVFVIFEIFVIFVAAAVGPSQANNVPMPLILRVAADSPDPAVIREAVELIRRGLVVAYPTDTLYGLAVDPRNAGAVKRLFELKGRAETSALTLIAADAG